MDENKNDKKLINLSGSSKIEMENDIIFYSYKIKSNIFDDANSSYKSILESIEKFKKILSKNNLTKKTKIKFSTYQEWEYEPKRRLLGYITNVHITFETLIEDIKNIANIQNELSDIKYSALDDVQYSVSDMKMEKYKLAGLKKAIDNFHMKAKLVIDSLYNRDDGDEVGYEIIKFDTDGNKYNNYERSSMKMASRSINMGEGEGNDILSSGNSILVTGVSGTITPKN